MNEPRIAAALAILLFSTPTFVLGAPLERGRLALPRPAEATGIASVGSLQWVSRTTSREAELIAIDASDLDQPRVSFELEAGAGVSGLVSDGEHVFAATGLARQELWVIEGRSGAVLATLDLPKTRRAVRIEWAGTNLVKVSKSRGPGPEVFLIDVSDPTDPQVVDTMNTGRNPEPDGQPTIDGYFQDLVAIATTEDGIGTLIYHVLVDSPGTDFRVIERPIAGFPDANGDGVWRIACLGDSNTEPFPPIRPRKWCEYLQELPQDALFQTVNISHGGATANPQTRDPAWEDAFLHTAMATQADVDAIISAYGTNDLLQGYRPTEYVEAHRTHEAAAAAGGIPTYFVATVPIIGTNPTQAWPRQVNDLLRIEFPGRTAEFFEGFRLDEHHLDGLHLNDAGQRLRAERAWEAIRPR